MRGSSHWSPHEGELWASARGLWELARLGDRARIAAGLHPDYAGWDTSTAQVHDAAAAVLSVCGDASELVSYELSPLSVRVYGGHTGVVHYRYEAIVRPRGASPVRVSGKWTEVYARDAGRWLMVAVSGRPDVPPQAPAEARTCIRNEVPADDDAITRVTVAAFADLAISHHTEQHIVRALRRAGALTVSLVAELDGEVVGHVAISPLAISDGSAGWYGLGPISVLPVHQGKGIGSALMHAGLGRLKELGASGCALVGSPGYYRRFGFRNDPGLVHEGIPQEFFLALPFGERVPWGTVSFHEAFQAVAS